MPTLGRRYCAVAEITYVGGTLPRDAREALAAAVRADLGDEAADLSFGVSPRPHNVVTIRAILWGTGPVAAVTRISTAVDESLLATGLFEEFDTSGKILRVAPLELTERIFARPDDDA